MKQLYSLLTGALIAATSLNSVAEDYNFTYLPDNPSLQMVGFQVKDHYDACIYIPAQGIIESNGKVKQLKAMVPESDKLTNFKMWISSTLTDPGAGRPYTANLYNARATMGEAKNGMVEISVTPSTPVAMPEGGLYVGYSFDVSEVDRTNATNYPIIIADASNGDAAFIARAAFCAPEFMSDPSMTLTLSAVFEGDFQLNNVAPELGQQFFQVDKPGEFTVSLTNIGMNPIKNFDYVYTVGDAVFNGNAKINLEGKPGATTTATIKVDAFNQTGSYDTSFAVTKVNGEDNKNENATIESKLYVIEYFPKRYSVMEEFTGTWCGWCPRGIAGMMLCERRVPNFIGIAYHGRDIMELKDGGLTNPGGYPNAIIDRSTPNLDPYYGITYLSTPISGHIVNEMKDMAKVFTPAEIAVTAALNEDNTAIVIDAETKFVVVPEDGAEYRLTFVVTEDGMSGTTADWYQMNYLSGEYGKGETFLEEFYNSPEYLKDIEYDHVAVYATQSTGVEGSLPATEELEAGKTYKYTYTAQLSDFLNKSDKCSYQDLNRLNVVAMIVKQNEGIGTIVNAAKKEVTSAVGVATLDGNDAEPTEYYDLAGIRLNAPQEGINIVRFSDGSVRKVMIRR